MSTFFADIQGALNARLSTLAGSPSIAYENNDFDEQSGTEYLRATWLPAESAQASLGDTGKDRHDGLYQVDVFTPKDEGSSTFVDAIADHFKRGTILTQNLVNLRIVSVSVETARTEDNFYQVPVTIRYQTFTGART